MYKSIRILMVCLVLSGLLTGCLSLNKPAAEKRYFSLMVNRPETAPPDPKGLVLRISPFNISPVYAGKSLVYRDKNLEYQSDFYNEFLVDPGPMIRTQVGLWLTDAGLFHLVLGNYSKIMPDVLLEGSVASLYGDYRDINRPKAVLEIQFFLIDDTKPKSRVLLQKQLRREIPVMTMSPEDLVNGWNEALRQVLTDFEEALRQTDLKGLTAKSGVVD